MSGKKYGQKKTNYSFSTDQEKKIEKMEKVEEKIEEKEKQMKAKVPVNVRKTPFGEIKWVLKTGEHISVVKEIIERNVLWVKTKDGDYIMKEFLEEV